MDKKYRYRNGDPAIVIWAKERGEDPYPVISLRKDGEILTHSKTGRAVLEDIPDPFDLIEVSPYEDLKIDDPVMAYHAMDGTPYPRHFAGVEPDGRPRTWANGRTSFSIHSNNDYIICDKCRRPTKEELGK